MDTEKLSFIPAAMQLAFLTLYNPQGSRLITAAPHTSGNQNNFTH